MYRSNRFAMLLSVALLVSSAALLSGCRLGCAENDIPCKSGISATFTVPVPPTSTPLPAVTDPKQLVQAFITIYSGDTSGYPNLATLFDSAYAKVDPSVIACSALNTKENYGGITSSTIKDPVITGTVALVVASVVGVSRSGDVSFNLKQEGAAGWKIDSITNWIGGDITPDNPVGASVQSCPLTAPASGSGAAGTTTPGAAGTTTPGAGGASTTPTPLPAT